MSGVTGQPELDSCGCCATSLPELGHENRPGLSALNYRLGAYSDFMQRMLARISTTAIQDGEHQGKRPLAALTTRAGDDPAVAFLDAWAVVADVLTFYQERIANEGFLGTATERRSLLELARAIGYELNPGVAATATLAFTVEEAPGSPEQAVLPAGARVQSVPEPGEQPQTFETSADFTARAAWNRLRPRLQQPQDLSTTAKQLYLQGTATNLAAGDRLLLVSGSGSATQYAVARIFRVVADAANEQTRVDLHPNPPPLPPFVPTMPPAGVVPATKVALDAATVQTWIRGRRWTDDELGAFLAENEWDTGDLLETLAELETATPAAAHGEGVFALSQPLGFFGHNAPHYQSMPRNQTTNAILYPGPDWDGANGWQIWHEPLNSTHTYYSVASGADVFLERAAPDLLPDRWALLRASGSGATERLYWIDGVTEKAVVGFSLSGRVTGLQLLDKDQTTLTSGDKLAAFKVRNTTAYLQAARFALAPLPIDDVLETEVVVDGQPLQVGVLELMLDRLVLGLAEGQAVAIHGERADAPGVEADEVARLAAVEHRGGYTVLTFAAHLRYRYLRNSVIVNANCVAATHGETVAEILGSGNGAAPNQRFALSKKPLTYVPAATASGADSTLEVRVNGVLWEEAPSLYGLAPDSEQYIVRLDGDGKASVIFGDGRQGARPPTGAQNVTARYRTGTGLAGEVEEGRLTLLQSRPLGVRAVTNPAPAAGAEDPETLDSARQNAPMTVRTMERIVSLQDFEDFARTFAGIGKAGVRVLWNGENNLVHITVAGASGKPVSSSSALYSNLVDAIDGARDPVQQVRVDTFQPRRFNLKAKLLVDERYIAAEVLAQVEAALLAAFAFARRSFGQPVTAAEVVQVIHGVAGVRAVDLEQLYLSTDPAGLAQTEPETVLPAALVTLNEDNTIALAELLLINPLGMTLEEMEA